MEADVTPLAAFGAGLLSFVSPGVLPLIPGYVSYLAALALDEVPGSAPATTAPAADLMKRFKAVGLPAYAIIKPSGTRPAAGN